MSILKFILISVISIYLLLGILIYAFQEQLIFLPEQLPDDFEYEFQANFNELFIERPDGAVLNALHFQVPDSKGLIVYFHGNAGSLRRWGEVVEPFVQMGFEVLIMDYRGYGKSSGDRDRMSMLQDAEAIYKKALTLAKEDRIILYGRSIGSAFACHLAGKHQPSKLILEAPFYSMANVANKLFPIFPTSSLLKYNFRNYQSLKSTSCPIYMFHGTNDEVVPMESGKKLYHSIDSNPKEFIVVENGAHNNLATFERYQREISRVLHE